MQSLKKYYFGKSKSGKIPLIITINTALGTGASMTIPTNGTGYNYSVEWGDGVTTTGHAGNASYTYAAAGTYTIKIRGKFPKLYFNNSGDRLKLRTIDQWGDIVYSTDFTNAFLGCSNLLSVAYGDILNKITIAQRTFESCTSLTGMPSGATFGAVTTGGNMFYGTNFSTLPSTVTFNSLTNAQGMFQSSKITTLPAGVTLSNLLVGSFMFQAVGVLTSLPSSLTLNSLTTATNMFVSTSLTDLPSGVKLQSLTSGGNMFFGNTINKVRYSQLLNDMGTLNPNNSVSFHGGNSKYNASGQTARNVLTTSPRIWTITDGGFEA